MLRLFSRHLKNYKGESRRSYQKAFSSFQLYVIGNYSSDSIFDRKVVENWIIDNLIHGLSHKTVSFYLDKISSLYSGVACFLEDGKSLLFKEVKNKVKNLVAQDFCSAHIKDCADRVKNLWKESKDTGIENPLVNSILSAPLDKEVIHDPAVLHSWICLALHSGIKPEIVKSVARSLKSAPDLSSLMPVIDICTEKKLDDEETALVLKTIENSLYGEKFQWFAMRLRPKVKFQQILDRFALLSADVKLPEMFYPSEEIAHRIGRKVVWEGKPIIRDVVFFKKRKSEIYHMFSYLYDLAWCYRTPGGHPGNYAAIPEKAMEDFRKSLGILSPDFEIAPLGELNLKPGDEVIIVNGEYIDNHAKILKKPSIDEDGNKIYRVSLLNCNGHWDIGIDARLIKKV